MSARVTVPEAAPARFKGFGTGAISWFQGLEQDNSKSYFDATRDQYEEQVRGPLTALLSELCAEFGGTVRLFRQNRDVRFSGNKAPYKTTTYGVIYQRSGTDAGLYAQLSAAGLYAATGYYQMASDQIERFRKAVADERSGPKLVKLVEELEAMGLIAGGEALKTAPRGFPRDHPRVRLLCHKELIAGLALPPGPALSSRRALTHAVKVWRSLEPLCLWLDAHVGPSTIPPEVRWGRG